MKTLSKILILLVFYLLLPVEVYAARSLTVNANKSSIFGDEEIEISVASQSGFIAGETIYIKSAFYQDGSTNYFGLTKNNNNWIKNGDSTANQRQIQIGNWDGKLVARSDFSDSGYKGEGDYQLKIGFYYITSGGNVSSVNWSNNIPIHINEPDPTPTPVAPTSTPTPTNILAPTLKPTPSVLPSKTPTITILPSQIASSSSASSESALIEDDILGSRVTNDVNKPSVSGKKGINWGTILIIIGVIGIISACGYVMYRKYLQEKEEEI